MPVSGSAYTYAYATLGELVAWIIGWDLVLEYALGAATVAVGWSGNFVALSAQQLGIHFPPTLSAAPGTLVAVAGGDPVTAVFNLPAVVIRRWSRSCWWSESGNRPRSTTVVVWSRSVSC